MLNSNDERFEDSLQKAREIYRTIQKVKKDFDAVRDFLAVDEGVSAGQALDKLMYLLEKCKANYEEKKAFLDFWKHIENECTCAKEGHLGEWIVVAMPTISHDYKRIKTGTVWMKVRTCPRCGATEQKRCKKP